MKLSFGIGLLLATALGIGFSPARTWKSADGKKKFEAELKNYDEEGKKVTVIMRNGRTMTFAIDKLSESDQTYLAENGTAAASGGGGDAVSAAEFGKSKFGKALKKMKILEKTSFANHELASVPEYFILYYSASW